MNFKFLSGEKYEYNLVYKSQSEFFLDTEVSRVNYQRNSSMPLAVGTIGKYCDGKWKLFLGKSNDSVIKLELDKKDDE